MANEKNLLRPSELPEEERKRRASEAGKASGAARRKRRAMKTVLSEILALPADVDAMPIGVSTIVGGEIDNQTLLLAQLFRRATGYDYDEHETQTGETYVEKLKRKHIPPDVKAVQEIRNILGESRDTAAEKAERKARTDRIKADTEAIRAKSGAQEEIADDGFLQALTAEAADVWSEE